MYIKESRKENNLKMSEASIDLVQSTEAKYFMKSQIKADDKRDLWQVFKDISTLENLLIN